MSDIFSVGLYIRKLVKGIHGTPKAAALKAKQHGIRHVYILVCWQDYSAVGRYRQRQINIAATVSKYAEAFNAVGIRVFVWAYPWIGHEDALLDVLSGYLADSNISGVLLDPELGYKLRSARRSVSPHYVMRGGEGVVEAAPMGRFLNSGLPSVMEYALSRAAYLCGGVVDLMNERHTLVISGYGRPGYHKEFPWEVFASYGVSSPQFYNFTAAQMDTGTNEWFKYSGATSRSDWEMLPSVGLFGPCSEGKLRDYFIDLSACEYKIRGVIGWSWELASAIEWGILAEMAERFAEGPL